MKRTQRNKSETPAEASADPLLVVTDQFRDIVARPYKERVLALEAKITELTERNDRLDRELYHANEALSCKKSTVEQRYNTAPARAAKWLSIHAPEWMDPTKRTHLLDSFLGIACEWLRYRKGSQTPPGAGATQRKIPK